MWHIPDRSRKKLRPLLGRGKKAGSPGRPAVPYRTVFDGILFVLRTGCRWKRAPEEFGSGSTPRRRGVFTRRWRLRLRDYDRERGLRRRRQAIGGAMTKAPLGGEATGEKNYVALIYFAFALQLYRLIVLG